MENKTNINWNNEIYGNTYIFKINFSDNEISADDALTNLLKNLYK